MSSTEDVSLTSNGGVSKPALARLPLGLALVCLLILGGSYVTNAMDRQVFSVLLPGISEDYGFPLSQGGLLSTIFTLGIGVAGIPGAYLLNRYSRKTVIILGIVIYSAFTALTALSFGFFDMFAYRALSGVGEAIQNAALFAAVGAYFFKNRALAIGSLNFAYGVGAWLGPRLGGQFSEAFGAWHAPFYIFAAFGFVFVVLIALFVSKRFTEQVEDTGEALASTASDHLPTTLYNRNVVMFMISAAITGVAVYGYLGLYPTFLQQELGFSVVDSGTAVGMFGLGALMGIPAGLLGDRLNQRWILVVSLLAASVIGFLLFNGPTDAASQNWLSFLEGTVGSGLLFTNTYSVMQRSVRPDMVGRVSGIFVTSWYLPSAIAGYLFAVLHDALGWGGASIVQLTLVPLIGVAALLFVDMKKVSTGRGIAAAHH